MLISAQSQSQSCDLGQTLQLDLSFAMHTMLSLNFWLCYSGILSCSISLLKAVWAFPGKCGWSFTCLFGLWLLLLLLVCLSCYYQCSPYLMKLVTQDTFLINQISHSHLRSVRHLLLLKCSELRKAPRAVWDPVAHANRMEQVHTLLTDHDWSPVPSPNLEMDPTDDLRCKWHPPHQNHLSEKCPLLPQFLNPLGGK